jgi:hypothetical protein
MNDSFRLPRMNSKRRLLRFTVMLPFWSPILSPHQTPNKPSVSFTVNRGRLSRLIESLFLGRARPIRRSAICTKAIEIQRAAPRVLEEMQPFFPTAPSWSELTKIFVFSGMKRCWSMRFGLC